MKKIFFLFVLCTGLGLSSCNDDESTPEEFITAMIDGSAFEANTIIAIPDNTFGEEIILIVGTNADASFKIGLNIPTSTSVNIPQAIDATDFAITFTDAADNAFFTVGTIELSNNDTGDKVLEGTFSFTATDDDDPTSEFSITDGAFRIEY